jgi:hypothetical protein
VALLMVGLLKSDPSEVWLLSLMEDCGMPRKRHKAGEIVTKLRQADGARPAGRGGHPVDRGNGS